MNRAKQRLIDRRRAAREGKRFSAFYRSAKDLREGRKNNPFPQGGEEARCYEAGQQYAEGKE